MAGTHTLWSPSAGKRWRTCAGSAVMNDGVPDKTSKEAAEGTTYHSESEAAIRNGTQIAANVGQKRVTDGFKFTITEDDAEYAQGYVDRIRARAHAGCIVSVEVKTDTSEVLGIPGQSGTLDARIFDIANETLEIHDLKMGRGVKVYVWQDSNGGKPPTPGQTPAPRWAGVSDQLGIYGVSVWRNTLYMCDWKFLRLVIDQPCIGHYDEITLTREEVEAFAQSLYVDAQRSFETWKAYREDATHLGNHLTPSLDACRWCYRAGSCRTRAESILKLFPRRDQLQYMAEIPVTAKNLPTLSGAELEKALDRCEEIENWVRSVRAEALGRVECRSPDAPKGWKIVEGRKGDRSYDPEAAQLKAKAAFGSLDGALPAEFYTAPEFKSPAQLEKACKKFGDLGRKVWAAITGDPANGVPSLITQAPGRPSLVRDFDARPELAVQPVTFELRPVGEEFKQSPPVADPKALGAAAGLL